CSSDLIIVNWNWQTQSQCDAGGMFVSTTAVGKKLFRWREVLVFIARNLLPDGSLWKRWWPGWEGSGMILPALLLVLEWSRSGWDGRSQPMAFSVDRMICCSLRWVSAVEAANQTVIGRGVCVCVCVWERESERVMVLSPWTGLGC